MITDRQTFVMLMSPVRRGRERKILKYQRGLLDQRDQI